MPATYFVLFLAFVFEEFHVPESFYTNKTSVFLMRLPKFINLHLQALVRQMSVLPSSKLYYVPSGHTQKGTYCLFSLPSCLFFAHTIINAICLIAIRGCLLEISEKADKCKFQMKRVIIWFLQNLFLSLSKPRLFSLLLAVVHLFTVL